MGDPDSHGSSFILLGIRSSLTADLDLGFFSMPIRRPFYECTDPFPNMERENIEINKESF